MTCWRVMGGRIEGRRSRGTCGVVGNGIGIGIWRSLSSLALLIHREGISLNIENEICKMKTSG